MRMNFDNLKTMSQSELQEGYKNFARLNFQARSRLITREFDIRQLKEKLRSANARNRELRHTNRALNRKVNGLMRLLDRLNHSWAAWMMTGSPESQYSFTNRFVFRVCKRVFKDYGMIRNK